MLSYVYCCFFWQRWTCKRDANRESDILSNWNTVGKRETNPRANQYFGVSILGSDAALKWTHAPTNGIGRANPENNFDMDKASRRSNSLGLYRRQILPDKPQALLTPIPVSSATRFVIVWFGKSSPTSDWTYQRLARLGGLSLLTMGILCFAKSGCRKEFGKICDTSHAMSAWNCLTSGFPRELWFEINFSSCPSPFSIS